MTTAHTPGPWMWADVRSAGLQIRGPYKDSTRLMFSDIWRAFPEPEWDATMVANARLAAAAPELLDELKACEAHLHAYVEAIEYGGGSASKSTERLASIRAAIAKAGGVV